MPSKNFTPQELVDATETVLREAIRIQTLPAQERMERLKGNRDEAFAWLHGHPDFGYFECGSVGIKAFWQLIDYVMAINPQLPIDASDDTVREALTYVFLDRFVKNQVPVDWNSLQSVFSRTSKHLLGKKTVRRYAYPCALWSTEGPHQIDVGPVIFRRTARLLEQENLYESDDHFADVEKEAQDFAR